jgi:type II secretory pathway pseudopilin PulG
MAWLKRVAALLVTLISIAGTAFTIYSVFSHPKAEVSFDVASESVLSDIASGFPGISVVYDGQDLSQQGLSVRSLAVAVANTGDIDLAPALLDPAIGWGFCIPNARIASLAVRPTGTAYLDHALKETKAVDHSCVRLPLLVLDRTQRFQLDVMLTHPSTVLPTLEPYGKIAGGRLLATWSSRANHTPSRIVVAFGGSTSIQMLRSVGYTLAALLVVIVLIVIGAAFGKLSNRKDKRTRDARKALLGKAQLKRYAGYRWASRLYLAWGTKGPKLLLSTVQDRVKLSRYVTLIKTKLEYEAAVNVLLPDSVKVHSTVPRPTRDDEGELVPFGPFSHVYFANRDGFVPAIEMAVAGLMEDKLISIGPDGPVPNSELVEGLQAMVRVLSEASQHGFASGAGSDRKAADP